MIADRLADLSTPEFPAFEPFASSRDHDELYQLLSENQSTLSPSAATWARQTKDARLALTERFKLQSAEARAIMRGYKGPKMATFHDALAAEPALRTFAVSLLTSKGTRRMAISDPNELYQAVMTNPYLRHFLHVWLFFTISLTRLWANQQLNRDAVSGRDDLADLTLALYVGLDDAVLTQDRLIRDAFRMVDPSIDVFAATDL